MLEIIALIFITKEIGKLALRKGLPSLRWKIYTILAWVACEFAGIILGIMIFGTNNLFSVVMVGLAGAITGYFIIKSFLTKKPDATNDDTGV